MHGHQPRNRICSRQPQLDHWPHGAGLRHVDGQATAGATASSRTASSATGPGPESGPGLCGRNHWAEMGGIESTREEKGATRTGSAAQGRTLRLRLQRTESNQGLPRNPYIAGVLTCILQLGVASIPCGISGDWSILVVTVAGIVLSFASGALPQWSKEKWSCRIDTKKDFVLTCGNGSQHAIVILHGPDSVGLDLEDLAAAHTSAFAQRGTRLVVIALGCLWILLLISASGIRQNSWFLLAVGGMGILQNMYVAGTSRSPKAFGVPLEFVEVMGKPKVMDALFEVEARYPRLGKSMLPIFFMGELIEDEKEKWDSYEKIAKEGR
ncbi:hypothetical protein GE09DRAFT_1162001 [Coniochaeta sp. 2T2.1]|nr:hypothetical protein GE09DRAFT_1162001 [Coniochaeta sp. 2T2.1]